MATVEVTLKAGAARTYNIPVKLVSALFQPAGYVFAGVRDESEIAADLVHVGMFGKELGTIEYKRHGVTIVVVFTDADGETLLTDLVNDHLHK